MFKSLIVDPNITQIEKFS